MKTILITGLALALLLLPSCQGGIAEDEYIRVKTELTIAHNLVQNLQLELRDKEAEIQNLQTKLEAERIEHNNRLSVTQNRLEDEQDRIIEARNRIRPIVFLYIPYSQARRSGTEPALVTGSLYASWGELIGAINDPIAQEKFAAMNTAYLNWDGSAADNEDWENAWFDMWVRLFECAAETLESPLR